MTWFIIFGGTATICILQALWYHFHWNDGFDVGYDLGKKHGFEMGQFQEQKQAYERYKFEHQIEDREQERMDN